MVLILHASPLLLLYLCQHLMCLIIHGVYMHIYICVCCLRFSHQSYNSRQLQNLPLLGRVFLLQTNLKAQWANA